MEKFFQFLTALLVDTVLLVVGTHNGIPILKAIYHGEHYNPWLLLFVIFCFILGISNRTIYVIREAIRREKNG